MSPQPDTVSAHPAGPPAAARIGSADDGIQGAIREGWTLNVKQKLIQRITASWSQITGQPAKQVVGGLTEIDSDVSMEYGLIVPHPGRETEWFAKTPTPSTASPAPACNGRVHVDRRHAHDAPDVARPTRSPTPLAPCRR